MTVYIDAKSNLEKTDLKRNWPLEDVTILAADILNYFIKKDPNSVELLKHITKVMYEDLRNDSWLSDQRSKENFIWETIKELWKKMNKWKK